MNQFCTTLVNLTIRKFESFKPVLKFISANCLHNILRWRSQLKIIWKEKEN